MMAESHLRGPSPEPLTIRMPEVDAASKFKENGVISAEIGQSYRESILEKGDSEAPMELFKAFMGREPDENALLRRMGCEV